MKQLAAALPELAAIEELATSACAWGAVDDAHGRRGLADPRAAVRQLPIAANRRCSSPAACMASNGSVRTSRSRFSRSLVARLAWDDAAARSVDARADHRRAAASTRSAWRSASARTAAASISCATRPRPHVGGTPLIGGHRLSPRLPWYMGRADAAWSPRRRRSSRFVERELSRAPLAIALDLHSGFGLVDRLWYPYARTREPPPDLARDRRAVATARRDAAEPRLPGSSRPRASTRSAAISGTTSTIAGARVGDGVLLPLTLEMGSWTWVRKNPLQGLSTLGRFNPVKPHRHRRTLRRHLPLLDFLLHAVISHRAWMP